MFDYFTEARRDVIDHLTRPTQFGSDKLAL